MASSPGLPRRESPPHTQRGSGADSARAAEGICEQSDRVRDDADRLLLHTGEALTTLASMARGRLERRPYATLLTAAGIGYVLGGGVPLRFLTLALGIGLREVGLQAFSQVIAGAQSETADPSRQGGDPLP